MIETAHHELKIVSQKKIRREVFWQITFPLLVGILLIVGLASWIVFTAVQSNVRQAADTSLIFLLIPMMILGIIPLALLASLAYGVIWLNHNIPGYLHKAQVAFIQVRDIIQRWADNLAEPMINFKSKIAALKVLKRKS